MKIYNLQPETQIFYGGQNYYYYDYYNKVFDAHNYNKNKSDEFSYPAYLENNKQKMKDEISKVSLKDTFCLNDEVAIGDYQFDKIRFEFGGTDIWRPYTELGGGIYNECDNHNNTPFYCIRIFIQHADNADLVNPYIPMSKEHAQKFIQDRKSPDGSVNRIVYVKKFFSITSEQRRGTNTNWRFDYYFTAHIISIEVYADPAMTKKLAVVNPRRRPVTIITNEVCQEAWQNSPKLFLNRGQEKGSISKEKLVASDVGVTVYTANGPNIQVGWKIISFKMRLEKKSSEVLEFTAEGNKLTDPMKQNILASQSGDKIYFEAVKVDLFRIGERDTSGFPLKEIYGMFTIQ